MVQLGADLVVLAVAVLPDGDAPGDVGRAERKKEKHRLAHILLTFFIQS